MAKVADKYFKADEWKVIEEGFNPDYGEVSESIFSSVCVSCTDLDPHPYNKILDTNTRLRKHFLYIYISPVIF